MKIKLAAAALLASLGTALAGCSAGPTVPTVPTGSARPAGRSAPAVTGSARPLPAATAAPAAGRRLTTVALIEAETLGLTFQTDPVVQGGMRATVSCRGRGGLHIVIKDLDGSVGARMRCAGEHGEVVMISGTEAAPDGLRVEVRPTAGATWWLRVENCAEGRCPRLRTHPAEKRG